MSSKGAAQAGQTTTTNAPPNYMQPYIGTGMQYASQLLGSNGPQYYPGQQVADFNPVQEQAFGNTNAIDNTLTQGQGNPLEAGMFRQAAQAIQPQLASQFAGAGRDITGSMPLASQQLNNLGTQFFGQNYQNTAQNAMQAAGQQQALGGTLQGQSQNLIDANQNLFNYQQRLPYQQLGQYEQFLGNLQPGMQQSSPYFTNPVATALGTGLGALGLYNGGSAAMANAGSKGAKGSAGGGAGSAIGGAALA